jgi:hypothetical protein
MRKQNRKKRERRKTIRRQRNNFIREKMKKFRAARLNIAILLLLFLPLISIGWKLYFYKDTLFGKPIAKERLVVSQKFRTEHHDSDTTNLLLPSQSSHQRISNENIQSSAASFFVKENEGQRCLKVNPHSVRQGISYSYEFRGKANKYELDPTLSVSYTHLRAHET